MTIPNAQSSLDSWIDWLLHLHAVEIDLGLERVRQVAESMKITRPAPLVISVAGTNGKGSSVAMLVAILKAAGYNVGAYTSPHIQFFNERIQINGRPVDDRLIVDAFTLIESARQQTKLTYFEFSTLAALAIFNQSDLDVVVLEVGLGGRLDAVNVVDADVALITAIDIDHIEWLGDDRSVIATEKAGIMRSGKSAICSDGAPPESLQAYADHHSVPLTQFKRDFDLKKTEHDWSFCYADKAEFSAANDWLKVLPMPALKGEFQLQNAAGVIATLLTLKDQLNISQSAVYTGLKQARHPGRLESFQINDQHWLVDVAHNPQSAKALAEYLAEQSVGEQEPGYTAIFSVLNDKDSLPMVQNVAPFVKSWLIADLAIPRATPVAQLHALLVQAGVQPENIQIKSSVEEAVGFAVDQPGEKMLVWGSFFTVAQVYESFDSLEYDMSKAHG